MPEVIGTYAGAVFLLLVGIFIGQRGWEKWGGLFMLTSFYLVITKSGDLIAVVVGIAILLGVIGAWIWHGSKVSF